MATIQDLLKHCSQIIDIIRQAGAQNVLIFRGFSPKGEHDLNILIMNYQTDDIGEHLACEAHITDDLTALLGCTVYVTNKQSTFYERLNPSNSFKLPLSYTPENKELLSSSLQRIFGIEWEFVKRDLYSKETTEDEERRYHEEMESMGPWFERNEHEADEQEAAISRSKGVGFFTQPTAPQELSATVQITFVCGSVTITRNLSLQNISPAVTSKPELADKLATACSDLLQREGLVSVQSPTTGLVSNNW